MKGQYYLRARYYNPVVGRFLQEDTYRGDGLNLYAYCANNPVMYYDPSGHSFEDIVRPESGPFTKGASNYNSINNAPLTGYYHTLPEGTEFPDRLGIIADGIDVNSHSPHGQGHYTIFPTEEMSVTKFNELFKSLPWKLGDKKK